MFNTSVDHDVTNKPHFLNTYDKCRHIGILKYIQFMIIYNSQVTIFYYKSQDPSEGLMLKALTIFSADLIECMLCNSMDSFHISLWAVLKSTVYIH